MNSHRQRLLLIFSAWAIITIGLIVLIALEQTEGTAFGIVAGNEGVLFLALLDAMRVEARRRNPAIPAIADDVRKADDANA